MNELAASPAVSAPTYWSETLRPWPNLVFVAPWLLVYEIGLFVTQTPAARNGADAWLRSLLFQWGAPAGWFAPVALLLALLAWHLSLQQSWRVSWDTLLGMLSESLLFACGLILLGQTIDLFARQSGVLPVCELLTPLPSIPVRLLGFVGAGIYEEFLFRLCLIPAIFVVLRGLLVPDRGALAGAVLSTSVLFALAHYLSPGSDITGLTVFSEAAAQVQSRRELWFGFGFRFVAGLAFAGLFCWRGFGIAVGTHAVYDIVVGWVLVSEL
jgi:membrane protease YdiL (CAAX protease family)